MKISKLLPALLALAAATAQATIYEAEDQTANNPTATVRDSASVSGGKYVSAQGFTFQVSVENPASTTFPPKSGSSNTTGSIRKFPSTAKASDPSSPIPQTAHSLLTFSKRVPSSMREQTKSNFPAVPQTSTIFPWKCTRPSYSTSTALPSQRAQPKAPTNSRHSSCRTSAAKPFRA